MSESLWLTVSISFYHVLHISARLGYFALKFRVFILRLSVCVASLVASRRTAEKMSLDISFHVITFECFILVFLFRLLKSFRLCLIHRLDFSCCFAHKRPTNVQRSIQFNWPRFWIGYHSCDLTFRQDAALSSSSSSYFFSFFVARGLLWELPLW